MGGFAAGADPPKYWRNRPFHTEIGKFWNIQCVNHGVKPRQSTLQDSASRCCVIHKSCTKTTDIEKRSQNSYSALCNDVISHGAPISGGLRIFADHTRRNKCKLNASTIFARRVAFHACLSSCSDSSTFAPDNHGYFDRWKTVTRIPSIGAPCGDKLEDGGFWDLWFISVTNTHHVHAYL